MKGSERRLCSDPCPSWRENRGDARADWDSKGRRGSLLRRRGEIKATDQGFHAFPDRQEADLRGGDTFRPGRW
jgi:hypothetical protein